VERDNPYSHKFLFFIENLTLKIRLVILYLMTNNSPNQDLPEKLPPQNIEAEQSLLGSLMLDKNAIIKVADFLMPQDFYRGNHQEIYRACQELFEKGEPIDLLSLSNRLKERGKLEEVGGSGYLTELVNYVPTASHVLNYAKIVQRKKILRDLIEASHEIGLLGYNGEKIPICSWMRRREKFSALPKEISVKILYRSKPL